jgi:hypothetical protein
VFIELFIKELTSTTWADLEKAQSAWGLPDIDQNNPENLDVALQAVREKIKNVPTDHIFRVLFAAQDKYNLTKAYGYCGADGKLNPTAQQETARRIAQQLAKLALDPKNADKIAQVLEAFTAKDGGVVQQQLFDMLPSAYEQPILAACKKRDSKTKSSPDYAIARNLQQFTADGILEDKEKQQLSVDIDKTSWTDAEKRQAKQTLNFYRAPRIAQWKASGALTAQSFKDLLSGGIGNDADITAILSGAEPTDTGTWQGQTVQN